MSDPTKEIDCISCKFAGQASDYDVYFCDYILGQRLVLKSKSDEGTSYIISKQLLNDLLKDNEYNLFCLSTAAKLLDVINRKSKMCIGGEVLF